MTQNCSHAFCIRRHHLKTYMLKGFVDVDASEFFERVAPDSVNPGHRYKLVHPSVRQHVFAVRIIPV